jgi:hypothetical protein
MNVEELLCEWENTPGSDVEQKLRVFIERVRSNMQQGTSDEEIGVLRGQIESLKEANDRLEATVNKLRSEAAQIAPVAIDQTYSLDQFLLAVTMKKGGTYGWKVDYVQASHDTPGCREVEIDDIQRWQKDGRVPDWAYNQIEQMDFPERVGRSAPSWKSQEVDYLIQLYTANPHESNASFAAKCSERYGTPRSEQSIKGAIYRLGRQGRLPPHRPAKP